MKSILMMLLATFSAAAQFKSFPLAIRGEDRLVVLVNPAKGISADSILIDATAKKSTSVKIEIGGKIAGGRKLPVKKTAVVALKTGDRIVVMVNARGTHGSRYLNFMAPFDFAGTVTVTGL